MLKTTTSNITKFQEAIPWDIIPKTFQDCIVFTRRLGVRYLWVDSLCIIQDDPSIPSDWQIQSSRMAAIYQNSYVTLAASRSPDSTGGCFTNDYDKLNILHRLESASDLGSADFPIFARVDVPHVAWSHYHEHFPLMQRAWAYQERLLSPRTIHFAGLELQWECGHLSTCECGTSAHQDFWEFGAQSETSSEVDKVLLAMHQSKFTSNRGDLVAPMAVQSRSLEPFTLHIDSASHEREARSGITQSIVPKTISEQYLHKVNYDRHVVVSTTSAISWRIMVKRYASLTLTFPSDILPAFSGLASSWNANGTDRYLAGLWRNSLIHDLLWFTDSPSPRPARWRAPSWSWASLDLHLPNHEELGHSEPQFPPSYRHQSIRATPHRSSYIAEGAEITEAICTPAGPDPTGTLSSGHITVSCRAVPAMIYHWPEDTNSSNSKNALYSLIIKDNWYGISEFRADTFIWDTSYPDFINDRSTVHVLCLGVTTWNAEDTYVEHTGSAPIADHELSCLVVRERHPSREDTMFSSSSVYGEYGRVGTIYLSPRSVGAPTRIPKAMIDLDVHPWDWEQYLVEEHDWIERREQMGIVHMEPWQYDAHRRLASEIANSPIQTFKIV